MLVLGTAGHVDHGKSTLVHRLTGIHPDRLREEQERQMTIDLGFGWMALPSGGEVGIIDVPGHQDFIDNMLAGVGGFEAALLVIAADEGVRPQTREHAAILDLMEIPGLLVALSKIDLVREAGWTDLAQEEILAFLARTRFVGAPILPVSAVTGAGIEDLRRGIEAMVQAIVPRPDRGTPRLPIDRVFSMHGFGTVVTGTLIDGPLEVGQEVEILPGNRVARIRGLQTHRRRIERAEPGGRVAVNLAGVEARELGRGQVLATPGAYATTSRLDARVRVLEGERARLAHGQEVKLFCGTAQTLARTRILGADRVEPGENGWVQFELARPVLVVRGDPVILRRPSPGATLGGGRVADPHPGRRHRRSDARIVSALALTMSPNPEEAFSQALRRLQFASLKQLEAETGQQPEEALATAKTLEDGGILEVLSPFQAAVEDGAVVALSETRAFWTRRITDALQRYHDAHRLRRGMPREEIRSRLNLAPRDFGAMLETMAGRGEVTIGSAWVALPGREPKPNPHEAAALEAWDARAAGTMPPPWKEGVEAMGEELAAYYVESGKGVQVSADVVLTAESFSEILGTVTGALRTKGTVTVAEVRDLLGSSRKYALALLEHLDRIGVTKREGDVRRAGSAAPNLHSS